MGSDVRKGEFSQDVHRVRNRYTLDRGFNYEDNFVMPKLEIYHADRHGRFRYEVGIRENSYGEHTRGKDLRSPIWMGAATQHLQYDGSSDWSSYLYQFNDCANSLLLNGEEKG